MTADRVRVALTGVVVALLGIASVVVWTFDDSSSDQSSPAPASGASLFRSKGCIACHNGPDATSTTGIGPDLRQLSATAEQRQPGVSAEDYIRTSIVAPQAFIAPGYGNTEMPTLEISPDELDALVTYLIGIN